MSENKRRKSGALISRKRSKRAVNISYFKTQSRESTVNAISDNLIHDSAQCEDEVKPPTPSWRESRRIVELWHLAAHLSCTDCGDSLSLTNIAKETRYGYGSLLYIDCTCGVVNMVETNKRHRVNAIFHEALNKNIKGTDLNMNTDKASRLCQWKQQVWQAINE